ncbi:MAG: serine hydrolase, partial [Pyrinomonadaceae bacterium]
MILFKRTIVVVLSFVLAAQGFPAAAALRLPRAHPSRVDLSVEKLAAINSALEEEIAKKHLPGAVVLVARKGRVVWHRAYGSRAVEPSREPMTPNTIFDLASLTKVVATATS